MAAELFGLSSTNRTTFSNWNRVSLARRSILSASWPFGLVFRSGRVKMEMGASLDLVYPEEMRLLERLAGLEYTTA